MESNALMLNAPTIQRKTLLFRWSSKGINSS